MAQLHDLRLRLLVQQESEQISNSQPNELDLLFVQARSLCWITLLATLLEYPANDGAGSSDTAQAMGELVD